MFERPPHGREWASWLGVALWAGVIFATIPIARAIERTVKSAWGEEVFLYAVFVAIAAATAAAVRALRRAGPLPPGQAAWLAAVALLYAGYTWHLRRTPVEALHFVEYGVLGALAFHALGHRVRDAAIYPAAAGVGGVVGILDEAIQWATPERVWDLRDVWFNFVGAALVLVGIAAGIRPSWISPRPGPTGARALARVAALATALLVASLLNTPARIDWYAQRVPGLGALRERSDVMLEYGHLYEVPGIGRFRSRLSPEELARSDAERGAEAGSILARFPDDVYADFLALYSPITDPFLHEARVHLFRRDRYLATADEQRARGGDYRSVLTVGHRENRILEEFFPNTLRSSGSALPEERRAFLEAHQLADEPYESRVSNGLVTRFGERHVVAAGGALLMLLLAADRVVARRIAADPKAGGGR